MEKPSSKKVVSASLTKTQYAAIGEFITSCSMIEVCMHAALDELLSLKHGLKSILVGEPRYGELQDLLKRTAKAQELPDQKQGVLATLLSDGSFSNSIRSVVAHKMAHREGRTLVFTNHPSSKRNGEIFKYACSVKELENLTAFNLITSAFIVVWKLESDSHRYAEYLELRKQFLATPLPNPLSPKSAPKIPKKPRTQKVRQG